jgi:hypothetical protein
MNFTAIFSLAVGLLMIGQWSFSYLSKQIPELEHEPIRIKFHIVAEILTALALSVSGIALLLGEQWAKHAYLVSLGMLIYTLIVSPGYFAQKGDWKWVGFFAVLMVAGLFSLVPVL